MNGRMDEQRHGSEQHGRPAQTLEHQTRRDSAPMWIRRELRTLELQIANGENLQDVLEGCALRLTAMELVDARSEN